MDVFATLLFFAAIMVAIFKSILNGLLIFLAGVIALSTHLICKQLKESREATVDGLAEIKKQLKRINKP